MVLSLAAGIAVFLVLALALRWNFLLSAALGVGIYFAFWFLLAPKPDKFTLYFTDQQDAQEMQDLMAEAERDLSSLKASAEKITDVQTHSDAQALAKTGVRIYDYSGDGLILSTPTPGKDPQRQPLSHLLPGHRGPHPGPVSHLSGRGFADGGGASVPAKGARRPAQTERGL